MQSLLFQPSSLFDICLLAGASIRHIPLAKGNDFELGLLLTKFTETQSLRVRFQSLTGKSIAALRNYTKLRRLDVVVDDIDDHYDNLLVMAIFTLAHLEKLKLDVGPLHYSNLSDYDWVGLAQLRQLELTVSFKAPQSCFDCLLELPKLDNLVLHHGHPTHQTLEALTRLSCLHMYLPAPAASDNNLLSAMQRLTRLQSLQLDGQPTEAALVCLTALTGLTSLNYWPNPYRFNRVISTCPISAVSQLCQLTNLQRLQCAVVDTDKAVLAHLDEINDNLYQPPVLVPGSSIRIALRLWCMTI